jgi:hypothetical protein
MASFNYIGWGASPMQSNIPPPVKVQLSPKYKQNMLQGKWNLEGRFEF